MAKFLSFSHSNRNKPAESSYKSLSDALIVIERKELNEISNYLVRECVPRS